MMIAAYLLLGLAAVSAVCWFAYHVMMRHRQLSAELSRLERLTAEVAMSAGEVLDRADERIARLEALLARTTEMTQVNGSHYRRVEQGSTPIGGDHARVLELNREGFTAAEIATATGTPRGEVQLILSLYSGRVTA